MTSKQTELLQKTRDDIGETLQAIQWLNGRVVKIEEWRETHPRVCPIEKKQGDILKARAVEVAVFAVVLTALQIILKVLRIL